MPLYSITGLTHVAFGFLTGTDSGERLMINGSNRSRSSRATDLLLQTTRLYIKCALGLCVSIQIGLHA
jgi:hypothetical protein